MVVRVLGRVAAMSLGGIVAAGLGVVATSAPAAADTCGPGAGVSVVVDFRELGGGLQTLCDAGGAGKSAAALFIDNGYALDFATRQPGFVCRVSGVPASDPCVNTSPTTAYWGLYWSDGSNGSWAYSSRGADSLVVPAGGSVAFAWQGSGQRGVPAVSPPAATATPTPTTAPTTTAPSPTTSGTTSGTTRPPTKSTTTPTTKSTTKPTRSPTSTGTGSATPSGPTSSTSSATPTTEPSDSPTPDPEVTSESASESASESPSATDPGSPTDSASDSASVDPVESPTTEPSTAASSDATTPTEPRAAEESSRVPTWLTITILVLLLAAIGMSTVAARRRTRH